MDIQSRQFVYEQNLAALCLVKTDSGQYHRRLLWQKMAGPAGAAVARPERARAHQLLAAQGGRYHCAELRRRQDEVRGQTDCRRIRDQGHRAEGPGVGRRARQGHV